MCVCVSVCYAAFSNMLCCVNRREKLWICMEFCGGGSMLDIYHGTNFRYFAHKFVVVFIHLADFTVCKHAMNTVPDTLCLVCLPCFLCIYQYNGLHR